MPLGSVEISRVHVMEREVPLKQDVIPVDIKRVAA